MKEKYMDEVSQPPGSQMILGTFWVCFYDCSSLSVSVLESYAIR